MAVAKRWANQDAYDSILVPLVAAYQLPLAFVKAVIAHESAGFNPRAHRREAPRPSLPKTPDHPHGGDESIGLMQLLVRTARGLGFRGTVEELYDPRTNLSLGILFLRDAVRASGGNLEDALSRYNGGYRPKLGFGAKLPTGQYGNQAYVDRVMGYYRYFLEREAAAGAPPRPPSSGAYTRSAAPPGAKPDASSKAQVSDPMAAVYTRPRPPVHAPGPEISKPAKPGFPAPGATAIDRATSLGALLLALVLTGLAVALKLR